MGTAFLPILGIKFEWLEIHWISGVTLTVLVLIHIVRALFWQDWRNMMILVADVRDMWRSTSVTARGAQRRPHGQASTTRCKSSTTSASRRSCWP